jgi:hypothetical protein
MAGKVGLEPTTNRLTVERSTTELHPNKLFSLTEVKSVYSP